MGKRKKQEEPPLIVTQNPEVHSGEGTRWVSRLSSAFPAFQNKNYRVYFSGQMVSLIGTWLQIVAQGWLVLKITQSAFLIGLVTACSTIPTLLFTLFGGVIVDRFPKKKILFFTQSSAMILALVLGTLTVFNLITLWQIALLAFLLGIVTALDAPARQAFVAELVEKEQLPSAIALNSGTFNAARVIGPSIAGVLIGLVGTGGAFILNGLSYIAVIFALTALKVDHAVKTNKSKTLSAIKNGITYSFTHPVISVLLILAGVVSIFGWSYTTMMPLIAKVKFGLDATGLGYLYAASGGGSLLAAFIVGGFASRFSPVFFIIGGNITFTVAITLFTFTNNFNLALVLLFFAGFGLLAQAAMINTSLQNMVKSDYRGRVMSLYVLMFLGLTPLGNLQIGWVSEKLGVDIAVRIGAIIVFIFGVILFIYKNKIRFAYEKYRQSTL